MTDTKRTVKTLAAMTDPGEFERLVTAVLRAAKPEIYENLIHTGVNENGKPVKSPVDGVGWILDTTGRCVVYAAHTTTQDKDLRGKWLHDPTTVKPKKGKPTQPEGDLLKAATVVRARRQQDSQLGAIIALSTNREPSVELIDEVQAFAASENLTVDIWSASRIAHFLDHTLTGQWMRKVFLNVAPVLVSPELLIACGRLGLKSLSQHVTQEEIITREKTVSNMTHALVVGDSGMGKTCLCRKLLQEHLDRGGCGLVLHHETIETATSIEEALDIELRTIEPELAPSAGRRALALASEYQPLVVLVEDVNRAADPTRVLNKALSWIANRSESKNAKDRWSLLCPIWPRYLNAIEQQIKKKLQQVVLLGSYSDAEALRALERRAKLTGSDATPTQLATIAKELGNDPLLIALYAFGTTPNASETVDRFIDDTLKELESKSNRFFFQDYKAALEELGERLLQMRKLEPIWSEIAAWFSSQHSVLEALRDIFKSGAVLRLAPSPQGEDILIPRHDRVLLSLLSRVMTKDLQQRAFPEYLSEPFFAEAVGAAIIKSSATQQTLNEIAERNPLALFYAFQIASKTRCANRNDIVQAIRRWLSHAATHGPRNVSLRSQTLRILAETDDEEVIAITDLFKDRPNWSWAEARYRNGDFVAGMELMQWHPLGVPISGRQQLHAHVRERYQSTMLPKLIRVLSAYETDATMRTGSLYLAGYIGDSTLASAIRKSWLDDEDRSQRLDAYLWASARCCGEEAESTLGPVCNAWGQLSDEGENGLTPRNMLAAYEVAWAFRKNLPINAISFFIRRAEQDDLKGPITYMMRTFDHPDAVEHIARFIAMTDKIVSEKGGVNTFAFSFKTEWEHLQSDAGVQMSASSKERLLEISFDEKEDSHVRKSAFQLWERSIAPDDLNQISSISKDDNLYPEAVWARARRKDLRVIPDLIDLIQTNPRYWWQAGRYLWSDALTESLHKDIHRVAESILENPTYQDDDQWILSELLMELDVHTAESILLEEWEGLQFSPLFVQAALFLATPRLTHLANEYISQSSKPKELFRFLTQHIGLKTIGRTGLISIAQMEALVPYFSLLSDVDISSLWWHCNDMGWIDFRMKHLDPILKEVEKYSDLIKEFPDVTELDNALGDERQRRYYFWIEDQQRNGWPLPQLINALLQWLEHNRTPRAVEIVCELLCNWASRADLERLRALTRDWPEIEDIIENAAFSIRMRSLN